MSQADGVVHRSVVAEGGWEIGGMIGGEGPGRAHGRLLCARLRPGLGLDLDLSLAALVWMGRDGPFRDRLVPLFDAVVLAHHSPTGIQSKDAAPLPGMPTAVAGPDQ